MKIHRFFITDDVVPESDLVLQDPGIIRQIKTVLRLPEGAIVTLFNDRGQEARARVARLSSNQIICRIETVMRRQADAPVAVTVYCAILKRENFEWVAQKVTEIGAYALVPCLTARTVKQRIAPDRIAAIMREAAEQSNRMTVPRLNAATAFVDALDAALAGGGQCILFDPRGTAIEKTKHTDPTAGTVNIFVGPEGGWSDEEYALARDRGVRIVSLGGTVLRAETAAVVGAYMAVWGWGRA